MNVPWHLLTMSGELQTPTYTLDATGMPKPTTWTATDTGIPCIIQPATSGDAIERERVTGRRVSTGYFPWANEGGTALTIAADCRIVSGGVTYRVVGASMNAAGQSVLQTVTLEEDS